MSRRRRSAPQSLKRSLLMLTTPVLVWGAHFTVLYGVNTIACVHAAQRPTLIWIIVLMTVSALGLLALSVRYAASSGEEFLGQVSRILNFLSALAIAGSAATIFFVAACDPSR